MTGTGLGRFQVTEVMAFSAIGNDKQSADYSEDTEEYFQLLDEALIGQFVF
jgi:hypothetical protein